jgi:hypothetical protein
MANRTSTQPRAPAPIAFSGLGSPAHPHRATIARLGRYLGALALLGVGLDHLQQYSVDSYSVVPTIGTLFVLNFVSAAIVSLALVAPVGRLAGRWADAVLAVLAISGIGIAGGALAGLLISERTGLFGFMESGYRAAIVIAIALEVATVVLLGAFLKANGPGVPLRDGRERSVHSALKRAAEKAQRRRRLNRGAFICLLGALILIGLLLWGSPSR